MKEPYAQPRVETTINEGAAFAKSDTTLTVTSGTTLGAVANSYILIGSEVLKVTAVSTNDLTVTRAQDGTTAAAHADGAKVYRLTETTIATGNAADNGATTTATTIDVTLNTAALDAAVNSYIQIGSEVMLVTAVSTNELTVTRGTSPGTHADGAKVYLLTESTLDGPLTDSATTVNVDLNTAGLGAAVNSYILIGSEVLLVTNVATNALTVTRAQHGTTAAAHLDGAKVFLLKDTLDHTWKSIRRTCQASSRRAAAHRRGQRHRRRLQVARLLHGQGRVRPLHVHVPVPARPRAVDNTYTSYSCEAINCPTGMAWADLPWHPGGAGRQHLGPLPAVTMLGRGPLHGRRQMQLFREFLRPGVRTAGLSRRERRDGRLLGPRHVRDDEAALDAAQRAPALQK